MCNFNQNPEWFPKNESFPSYFSESIIPDKFNNFFDEKQDFYIIEFYANWCPSCQKFTETLEKLAQVYKYSKSDIKVKIGKIDCAVNMKMCTQYHIMSFPTLKIAKKSDWSSNKNITDIKLFKEINNSFHKLSMNEILNKINKMQNISIDSNILKNYNNHFINLNINKSVKKQNEIQQEDVLLSTNMSIQYAIENKDDLTIEPVLGFNSNKKNILFNYIKNLCHSFVIKSCRQSQCDLYNYIINNQDEKFNDLEYNKISHIKLCKNNEIDSYNINFKQCKGTLPQTRKYTCGLWLSFHSLLINSNEMNQKDVLHYIIEYIHNYFTCTECRHNFMKIIDKYTVDNINSKKNAVLYLWKLHNMVNVRLSEEELNDPLYPKIIWPSISDCNRCYNKDKYYNGFINYFNEDEIYLQLLKFYKYTGNDRILNDQYRVKTFIRPRYVNNLR